MKTPLSNTGSKQVILAPGRPELHGKIDYFPASDKNCARVDCSREPTTIDFNTKNLRTIDRHASVPDNRREFLSSVEFRVSFEPLDPACQGRFQLQ